MLWIEQKKSAVEIIQHGQLHKQKKEEEIVGEGGC